MTYLTHEVVLVFLLRVILGLLFFFQGYDKIFNVKISGVISFFREESREKHIPDFILVSSAYFTCLVEMVFGGLLIIGLFKTWAMYLLGVDLILVSGAFSLLKPMWDMQMVYPRLILLSACLYLPAQWDILSLDHFIR
jgi:putative oxidoreductase